MKNCLWCKEPILKGRKDAECHTGSCAAFYRWHKCSEDEVKELPDRFCPYCNEKLIRGEKESSQAWRKRVFCNKSHKAFHRTIVVKPDYTKTQEVIAKSGVKVYERGSAEFNRIAALYL